MLGGAKMEQDGNCLQKLSGREIVAGAVCYASYEGV